MSKITTTRSEHSQNSKKSKTKSPLKRSTLGLEFEFFILNKQGEVVSEADILLNKIGEKNKDALSHIVKEVGRNMIEVGSYPSVGGVDTIKSMVSNLKLLLQTADEQNLVICPLGIYPGKCAPKMRTDEVYYRTLKKIWGENKFRRTARIVGFHFHYALPWGVFDSKNLTLKKLVHSKNKQSLVNSYNFLIAADPALATFLQSSPFYQGTFVAKDTRMLLWRAWEENEYPDSIFTNFTEFGTLPSYAHTLTDIQNVIEQRHNNWMKILTENAQLKKNEIPTYKSNLLPNWSPVRFNPHGTLEQRGMDMNHFRTIGSVSLLLSRVLRAIQEDYLQIETSDIAIKEPFKIEKKTIFIPPDTYIKKELQKESAYQGMGSEKVWYYCKRLMWLVKILEGKKVEDLLEPLEEMIKDKKTLSDIIIEQAKQLGYTDFKKTMPKEVAAQIALEHSKTLFKEIVLMEKFVEEIEKG